MAEDVKVLYDDMHSYLAGPLTTLPPLLHSSLTLSVSHVVARDTAEGAIIEARQLRWSVNA